MKEIKHQSVLGRVLDCIFPPRYGFCIAAYTRACCPYFRAADRKCHALDDENGECPSRCTGRRA